LGLAVAAIVGVVLVSASGAATTQAQKVSKTDVSTRAAVVHYLRSIHVNAKHAVIQRGLRNYAGARCPGSAWTCASTKHTVVQIAKPGGQNRFVCRSNKCVVVQISGRKHGVYRAGRQVAAAPTKPTGSTATCVKTGSGATTGSGQTCTITQTGSGPNLAGVYENTQKVSGLVQTAQYAAMINQTSSGSNRNTACVTQNITLDGSAANTNGKPTTASLQAFQTITITQNSPAGPNSAQYAADSTGKCTSQTLTQSQTLSSTITATGPITQNEDTKTTNPSGVATANVVTRIDQNQGASFFGSASGLNTAAFNQTSDQSAVANSTKKAAVTQQQDADVPAQPFSGIVGTINQDSSALSTADVTQTETQCEDAVSSSTTPTTCDKVNQDPPAGVPLSQTQYGPEGFLTLPTTSAGSSRVHAVHKGYGKSQQTGAAPGVHDILTLNQTSKQYADLGNAQQNLVQGDCSSAGGACTTSQLVALNSGTSQDGWTAPSIDQININCPKNQNCTATPPPAPAFVSGPNDPNPSSSAAFHFTDTATGGIHFLCKIDGGTPQTCSSGVAFFQGYGPRTFQVAASDSHGNVSAYVPTSAFSWTNVPPDPTIKASSKPANPEPWGNTDTFQFTDAESPVHFQCTLDGNTTGCDTGSKSYVSLLSGEHTFSVRAYDTTDTYGSINSASYTWWITPPDPTIDSQPTDPDFFGNSDFTFSDQDTSVQYRCKIDSQPAASCSSGSASYSNLDPGSHTFTVTAYGANDSGFTHPNTTPVTYIWTILPLEVSALGGDGSAAGWACEPGGPIGLTLGTDTPNTYAEIDLTDVAGTAIDGLSEPTFTTNNYAAGSPRYYITLDNGQSLWGYPPNAGLNDTDFAWAINNGNSYLPWSAVQSTESGAKVTGASVIADGDQDAGVTDKIGELQFNGTTFNSGTCS
jgi:hypothetical protein